MSNPDRFVDHFKHCNTVDVGLGSFASILRCPLQCPLGSQADFRAPRDLRHEVKCIRPMFFRGAESG
jgi:hypothetical protein